MPNTVSVLNCAALFPPQIASKSCVLFTSLYKFTVNLNFSRAVSRSRCCGLQERMLMEPCHRPHDVLYIVVAPENDYILSQASAFFQQLSVTYKQCRLGHHCPISDKLRDGVMRVGRINAQKVADEPLDDWFHSIGMYSRECILLNKHMSYIVPKSGYCLKSSLPCGPGITFDRSGQLWPKFLRFIQREDYCVVLPRIWLGFSKLFFAIHPVRV